MDKIYDIRGNIMKLPYLPWLYMLYADKCIYIKFACETINCMIIDLDTHGYVPMNSEKWPHIIIVMDRCCLEKKKLNDLFVCVAADMSWVYEIYLTQ